MAPGQREIALLVAGVEIGAAFGLKGLGNASQSRTGNGIGNFNLIAVIVLVLEVDEILLQNIGAPFAVDLHVLVHGHIGEVESLFNAAVHVEPGNEDVATVVGVSGNGGHLAAVGNGDVRMGGELGSSIQGNLIQIELDLVSHRFPVGIKRQIAIGHSRPFKIILSTGIALRSCVPTLKNKCVGFQISGVRGNKIFNQLTILVRVVVKRLLVHDAFNGLDNSTAGIVKYQIRAISIVV